VFALENRRTARGTVPIVESDDRREVAADEVLVCRRCQRLVTTRRQRMEVQGSHAHRFMNPTGFLYEIGCFSEAVGCLSIGPQSTEYPWFQGFAWRCAHCGGCSVQLGWQFRGANTAFFGLILDRLASRTRETT
jgi:hypothetical protein